MIPTAAWLVLTSSPAQQRCRALGEQAAVLTFDLHIAQGCCFAAMQNVGTSNRYPAGERLEKIRQFEVDSERERVSEWIASYHRKTQQGK